MKLVIVESPAKCTTIKRYLGDNYIVEASYGHVRDLATKGKGGLGVDVDHGFAPTYVINKNKEKVVSSLIADSKKADEVILATDPDREGEAIAWHLASVLGLDPKTAKRLEFHEITRDSITNAINNPRTIDEDLVASQETRRILDRIIGFKLSSLLNKKINSRSAGRVQSAALKLICDHDLEIENFKPEEYYNILTKVKIGNKEYDLTFIGVDGKAVDIKTKEQADAILNAISKDLKVISVNKTIRSKESKEPFTTSTMQQEAFSRLKMKTKRAQELAQQLYEGIEVNGEHVGLITYIRTDSTRLSPTFIARSKAYIEEKFGKEYVGNAKQHKLKENEQDAHEAIRPTSNHRIPESLLSIPLFQKNRDLYNLYKLIYNRAVASIMTASKDEVLTVIFGSGNLTFKLELSHNIFPGYESLISDMESKKDFRGKFPEINVGDSIELVSKSAEQKFTQAPAHYSEAKFVKVMEEVGIGRPSTYVSTLDTLKKRKYINDKGGVITITEQGKLTIKYLDQYFKDIVNAKYTADMETKLDHIQEGEQSSIDILTKFYGPFIAEVKNADEEMKKNIEYLDEICPECGARLKISHGKNGEFIGCSNFPKCRYVKPQEAPKEIGEKCPECGKPLVERMKNGKKFIGCSGYPTCKYTRNNILSNFQVKQEIVKPCPKCGGNLIIRYKRGNKKPFLGCSNYPKCTYAEQIKHEKK